MARINGDSMRYPKASGDRRCSPAQGQTGSGVLAGLVVNPAIPSKKRGCRGIVQTRSPKHPPPRGKPQLLLRKEKIEGPRYCRWGVGGRRPS